MDPTIEDMGVPKFARLEMALSDRASLPTIAAELRTLANTLEATANHEREDGIAALKAYRHIRAASAKLRGSN